MTVEMNMAKGPGFHNSGRNDSIPSEPGDVSPRLPVPGRHETHRSHRFHPHLHRRRRQEEDAQQHLVAEFEGSFAPDARPVLKPSDGPPWFMQRSYWLGGWKDVNVWKSAFVEFVATSGIVYLSGQIDGTLMTYGTPQIGGYIGISNIFLLSTFIYATAPASGGHLNPMISFSAIFAGICPLSRGILYLCAQTLGSALAGGVLAGVWGYERSIKFHGGGCFYDPQIVSAGQVFLNEIFASFVILYLAYGVGLDPRQALLFGPRLGPLLVGISLGLVSFSSSGIIAGYTGAQMNPARCFAFGIARRNLSDQWIWWFGPAIASLLLAVMYNLIPPYHAHPKQGKPSDMATLPTLPVQRSSSDLA